MPFADGLYTIRVDPEAPGVGAMYITGHKDVNEHVTIAAQDPNDIGRQIWKLVASKDEVLPLNKYVISMWTSKDINEGDRNLSPGPLIGNPDGPVITTSVRAPKWVIEENSAIPGACRISVPEFQQPPPFVQHFLVTGGIPAGSEVTVRSYDSRSQIGVPRWVLHKID